MPLVVATWDCPASSVLCGHGAPPTPAAALIAAVVCGVLTLFEQAPPLAVAQVGSMLIQAELLAPTAELLLLEMNDTIAPHPSEVLPPKKHELRPIGNMQPTGGGFRGGLAIAIAWAEIGSVWKPS